MIEYLDPRAKPGMPVEPFDLSADLDGAVNIGLLANGFPDSVAFLQHVEEALTERLPEARFHHYNKGDASSVVSDQLLETIVGECRAVVAAYGH